VEDRIAMTDFPHNELAIDISHWNTITSFADIRGAGVIGVVHKYSEGGTYVDPTYANRRTQARAAGLLWGRYHFATGSDVDAQVAHFLKGWQSDELLALDWEDSDNQMTLNQAERFVEQVEQITGQIPALYSGNTLKEALGGKPNVTLSRCRLWLAHYAAAPVCPPGWDAPWLWQWTDKGRVTGASGDIDLDSYAGTPEGLVSEWIGPEAEAPAPKPEPEPGLDVYTVKISVTSGAIVDVEVDGP
jgi:lysozyme